MSKLVIVESPAKAKTIERYLGPGWEVLASYGHVRDLLPKDGSVKPDEGFAMVWQTDKRGEERLREIAKRLGKGGADELWLATDPDREGEAISWHIVQALQERKKLGASGWKRVTFNAITKDAVQEAFANPRALDDSLVQAYLARRALDYLYGFSVSPVLWRKLPGSRSAGRVQSVALRLVCEREEERERFTPVPYWMVEARFSHEGKSFIARPAEFRGQKIPAKGINDEALARELAGAIEAADPWRVAALEKREELRRPKPPFITSTLQQEASSRLGFQAQRTMRVAQSLYEAGRITYMRTDGLTIAGGALMELRREIANVYGKEYAADRGWKSKARNAQEAHEAIRPTNITLHPEKSGLSGEEEALYRLIWQRTMASQMSDAKVERATATLTAEGFEGSLRASGLSLLFPGYMRAWSDRLEAPKRGAPARKEKSETAGSAGGASGDAQGDGGAGDSSDDGSQEKESSELPVLREGDAPARGLVSCDRRETRPPGRYSEAALVRRMEELGIGRPSTYASILQVLRDREYVSMESRSFIPQDLGRVVNAFMKEFFPRYVEYDFTAKLEEELDLISDGKQDWKSALSSFWTGFSSAITDLADLKVSDVIDALDRELGPHFFPLRADEPDYDPRLCPACGGRLGIKLGRTGGFIGCSNYPDCRNTRQLGVVDGTGPALPRSLGAHPATGLEVRIMSGPYGPYIQEGETPKKGDKDAPKPRRSGLVKGEDVATVTLERAVGYLALPRPLGEHDGEKVTAGLGRYGPWVKRGRSYASIPAEDDLFEIGLNRAVALIETKLAGGGRGRGRAAALRELGEHPDGGPISVMKGRYGPYVKHGKINATLPSGTEPETVTLEEAVALIAKRAERAARKGGAKRAPKKKAAKKKTATKKTAKKAASKKTPAKKAAAKKTAPEGETAQEGGQKAGPEDGPKPEAES